MKTKETRFRNSTFSILKENIAWRGKKESTFKLVVFFEIVLRCFLCTLISRILLYHFLLNQENILLIYWELKVFIVGHIRQKWIITLKKRILYIILNNESSTRLLNIETPVQVGSDIWFFCYWSAFWLNYFPLHLLFLSKFLYI